MLSISSRPQCVKPPILYVYFIPHILYYFMGNHNNTRRCHQGLTYLDINFQSNFCYFFKTDYIQFWVKLRQNPLAWMAVLLAPDIWKCHLQNVVRQSLLMKLNMLKEGLMSLVEKIGLQGYAIQSVGIVMSCLLYVYFCWSILSMLTEALDYFGHFWTVTPVWIYQWLWNDTQSLK